ncbi:hypothetical protein EJ02DRAFT_297403, partial [Clathrospora elynae]
FCFECRIWIFSELDWERHSSQHANSPDIIYGPIIVEGIVAAPRRCLYCMKQGRFVQMESQSHYVEHIEGHISQQLGDGCNIELRCPHHSCAQVDLTQSELRDHFDTVHGISL